MVSSRVDAMVCIYQAKIIKMNSEKRWNADLEESRVGETLEDEVEEA
jgi:hypothetical protein